MRRFDDEFLALAYGRIQKALVVFTIAAAAALYPAKGWQLSAGVLAGGLVALINFVWMRASLIALTNRIADAGSKQQVKSMLLMRFLVRYALIVTVVSVIIASSARGAKGVVIGLLLAVPALLFEVVYEAAHAFSGE